MSQQRSYEPIAMSQQCSYEPIAMSQQRSYESIAKSQQCSYEPIGKHIQQRQSNVCRHLAWAKHASAMQLLSAAMHPLLVWYSICLLVLPHPLADALPN